MQRILPVALVAALAILILAAPATAAGLLVPRDGSPPLKVQSHRVAAEVENGLARTTLRQTFLNPHNRMLEAIYVFPLPEGAALIDVAMEVGGQRLEGLLAERRQARKIYDDIVRQQRDPALVEQIGRSKFRLSVFPVMPKEETVVEITWIQRVPLERGAFRYVYPLATSGAAVRTTQDFTFSVRMISSVPFTEVTSSTKDMHIVKPRPGVALASFEKSKGRLDRDIVVTAKVESPEACVNVSTYREEGRDGWFLAVVSPPQTREDQFIPRDVTLVLDTSGSMKRDGKIKQAKDSALWLLDHLRPSDRVNVLRFSSDVQAFAEAPVPATAENLKALREFVKTFVAAGGTALDEALTTATKVEKTEGRVNTIVLLTDGRPTIGMTEPELIVKRAKRAGDSGLRIFPFGVGDDLDANLIRGIASAGRGRAEVFAPGGEIVTRLTRFLDRTSSPVISDLTFKVDGVPVHDVFPRPLPDVYLGEQLAISGRFRTAGKGTVTVEATVGTEWKLLSAGVEFPAESSGSPAVKHLFARQKLDYLEEVHRLRLGLTDDAYYAALDQGAYSTAGEIVTEIVDVSLESGVQCAYTSFLVLLPEDKHRLDPRDLAAVREALDRAGAVRRETESDRRSEESVGGGDRLSSDAPFDGPSTNAAVGIGGGAGGAFGGRGGHRNLRAFGGGARTEDAVNLALEWLKHHQHRDGYWDADGFKYQCKLNHCSGAGAADQDPTVTGLAILAFLGAGETHKHGRYKRTVREGLKYLKQIQDPEGCFGPRAGDDILHRHAICTLAMAEAYALTGSPLFKQSAQSAIDFLVNSERPGSGAWGRGIRDQTVDAATSFWAICALKSAKAAGLRVPDESFLAFMAWLDGATSERGTVGPATGHSLPMSEAGCTAAGLLGRIFCGENPNDSELIQGVTARGVTSLPVWSKSGFGTNGRGAWNIGTVDFGAWYFGTLAYFQVGGHAWKQWNENLKKQVIEHQVKEGDEQGSWIPAGPEGSRLGRVGVTALMAMCTEVYYRYGRVFRTR